MKESKRDIDDLQVLFQEALKLDQSLKIGVENILEDLNPLKAYNLFLEILPEEMIVLNMNKFVSKPVHLIMTHIIVPPNSLRPSVPVTPTLSNEDDLTNQVKMIIKVNYEL